MEGMRAEAIAKRFSGSVDRYFFFGPTGFVSDDTEQSALVAQSLSRHPRDLQRCVRAFRRSLLGWFLRLPWGIGFGTMRACIRIALGFHASGVSSAGNGAAMRAAVVGAFFFDSPAERSTWSDALARVTHTDARAVEAARFVAALAAACVASGRDRAREEMVLSARDVVEIPALRDAIDRATRLARDNASTEDAARELGCSGFVVHTIGITAFCFVRFGDEPGRALAEAVRAGGDTDSHAAIVGAWLGAMHGIAGLPAVLVSRLQAGPFGGRHLRSLGEDLGAARDGATPPRARYSWAAAMLRNIAMYPVVVVHAFRILLTR
jgi:ADP-ribosylglycohydrolase